MDTTERVERRHGYGFAAFGTLVHAGLVLALFVLYVVVVPAAKRTFDDFGVSLPWASLVVIRTSNWIAAHWWQMAPVIGLLGAADFWLLTALRSRGRRAALLWLVGVALVLAALVSVTGVAVELPMATLREALNN